MKYKWKELAALFCYALGIAGWCYIGAWMTLTKPVKGVILAQMAGKLSLSMVLLAALEGFLYLSVAGAVWCIGYMLSNYFKKDL